MHKNCTGLWGEDFELATQNLLWYCKSCIEGLFPFNHFDEEMDFLEAIDIESDKTTSIYNVSTRVLSKK